MKLSDILESTDTHLEDEIRRALDKGDDYTARQYAKMAATPEKRKRYMAMIKKAMYSEVTEGTVTGISSSWDKKPGSGRRVKMDYDDAHKYMTTDEYLEQRELIGPHDFDLDIGGEIGTVGVRYTGKR